MLKIIAAVLLMTLLAVTIAWACPTSPDCPVHDQPMYFAGRTKVVNGHVFALYRCPLGDSYWVRCD